VTSIIHYYHRYFSNIDIKTKISNQVELLERRLEEFYKTQKDKENEENTKKKKSSLKERLSASAIITNDNNHNHKEAIESTRKIINVSKIIDSDKKRSKNASSSFYGFNNNKKTSSDEQTLSNYRKVHDNLTESLLQKSNILKRNNLMLHEMVEQDKKILGKTEHMIATNDDKLQKESKSLNIVRESFWQTTKKLFKMLFFLMATFLFMYFFIKFTRK